MGKRSAVNNKTILPRGTSYGRLSNRSLHRPKRCWQKVSLVGRGPEWIVDHFKKGEAVLL
jgi:hypothetical protein